MHSDEASTPGADVGHVEQLEQALDGAVLAERAVQHREDGVGAEQAAARRRAPAARRRARASAPSRSSSTGQTSWPAARTPATAAPAEASETSCSDERPPCRTATLMASGVAVASAWASGSAVARSGRR